jgi:hypothetical protein
MRYVSAAAEQLKAFSTLTQTASGTRRGTGTLTAASRDVQVE